MHVIKPFALLQLLPMVSITQAIIIDTVSLATWPEEIQGLLHTYTMQAFNLAFTQASAGSTQLDVEDGGGPIWVLATWLFTTNGRAVAANILDAIGLINQYFTTNKATTDYEDNPIVYFGLGRFRATGREDGALWDSDAGAYAGGDPAVIQACQDGTGNEPPHFLAFNYGPRDIHDTIDICPWYIRWLSENGWPMTARWNEPGAVRSLTESAMAGTGYSFLRAMDYLQGLDQKLLSAMSLIRPVLEVPPVTVPPQKIWTDCVDFPNPQNPYSLGFFTSGVHFIELGYTIGANGAITGYSQPESPGYKRKQRRSFGHEPKTERDPLPV